MGYPAIALAVVLFSSLPFGLQASFIDADQVASASKPGKTKSSKKRKTTRARAPIRAQAGRAQAVRAQASSALNCMAQNIYFEAGIEDRQGKIAVANVTMNRLKSRHYPDSVCSVVFQRSAKACAFSWTCDGKSNLPPSNELYQESLQIARLALSGALKDVTGAADHYHANYVSPGWGKRDKLSARIGRHLFYKLLDG
ncbi:MAG: cell wall hydrolase [Gammaproteobacteria bacterium]|nr:cell wall hydrolase [Gammaproteobacteria bacterium]